MAQIFGKMQWWGFALATVMAAGFVLQQVGMGVAEESHPAGKKSGHAATPSSRSRVAVVKPHKGGIPRSTTQPGTMESFDYADLYAKVSGYIGQQSVDIGDEVKEGQVLAEIDAPEFLEALHEEEAAITRAKAEVVQMEARVNTANAEYDAATANIEFVKANLGKAVSYLKFRKIQYDRISALFAKKSIEERLVDEKEEERDAAQAAETSARAAIVSAEAQAVAAKARIESAKADVLDAKAKVRSAEAKAARAAVFVKYLKIVSPYNGRVTRRSFHVGDFVRAADQGGNVPLLTVARTDVMRVVVQVPERDVPYTNVGDPAEVEIEALAGEKFPGKVARIANSEDRLTRTMRTEIDLENPRNRLRDGMFGRIKILADDGSKGLTVPSSSIIKDAQAKKVVFVVKNGKVHRTHVEVGQDDGARTEILSGLKGDEDIISRPNGDLADGAPVEAEMASDSVAKKAERS